MASDGKTSRLGTKPPYPVSRNRAGGVVAPEHILPSSGNSHALPCRPDSESLPSRIVNAALVNNPLDSLDCECSLGVFNDLYKPKRFHWSIFSTKLFSKIIFTEYLELFADPPPDLRIYFNFYNAQSHKCSIQIQYSDYRSDFLNGGILISDLINLSELSPKDFEDISYFTMFSEYGGFVVFSSIAKGNNMTIEHSF